MSLDHKKMKIIFFDGDCGFCDLSVRVFIYMNKNQKIKFAPLKGKTAKLLLEPKIINALDTMVFYDAGSIFKYSDAIFKASQNFAYPWKLLSIFIFVPHFIRDYLYGLIEKNRHRIIKKNLHCNLKTKEKYFLK